MYYIKVIEKGKTVPIFHICGSEAELNYRLNELRNEGSIVLLVKEFEHEAMGNC